MEELAVKLSRVNRSYEAFVIGILSYIDGDESRLKTVTEFVNNNPNATTSEIVWFVANQPDFLVEDEDNHYI